jgi:membrane carboxypeptidase/penicillin-binding protein PbpC
MVSDLEVLREGWFGSFKSQARPLLSGVASAANIVNSRVSDETRHEERKTNFIFVVIFWLSFIHVSYLINLN